MKNAKLVLLSLVVATMGLVSCEMEELVDNQPIQEKTNTLEMSQKGSMSIADDPQNEVVNDTSVVYSLEEDHGDKGDSKPKGDD
jgi:hypothetical protein